MDRILKGLTCSKLASAGYAFKLSLLLFIIGLVELVVPHKYSNCLIYAVQQLRQRGGHVIFLPSRYGWWPHVIWSQDLKTYEEWVPLWEKATWAHNVPPVLFEGKIITGTLDSLHLEK